ncbi:exosome complex exonuclease Rrp41 [Candidatus Thorarchaeota archaeon]|jgi:exosome complex component RRP41|nr:MAG: exosome complex exonuclease Rrp41 [Candidatus Thorarchaeota archaeon]
MSPEKRPDFLISPEGLRFDGRRTDELRPIEMKVGVLKQADGSASIRQGKTYIIAGVYGPRELHPRHLTLNDRAYLRVVYRMATFSVPDRKRPAPSRREREISMVIANALAPSIFLEEFPKAVIDVFVQVIQADGGTRCAAINAASLALADAGIPMRSLIPAVAVGKVDGKLIVDLGDEEDKYGGGDVPMAIMPHTEELTLLQQDGSFKREELMEAIPMGVTACKYLHELQKEALKSAYVKKPDDGDEEDDEDFDDYEDDLETDLGEAEIMEDED